MGQSPPTLGPEGTRVLNIEVQSQQEYDVLMLVLQIGLDQLEDANPEVEGGDEVVAAARALVEQVDENEPVWPP